MRDYELVLVLNPQIDEEAISSTVERVKSFVAERGGAVTEEERWGLRRLAYPIQKFRDGHYILTRLQMDPSQTRDLESTLRVSDDVIRHLLVRCND